MAKYKLVIDPGHGGNDPGAVSKFGREKDYTLLISQYQLKRFKELGVSVAITRDTDKALDQFQRTALAKEGEYCISNHLNAGGGDRGEVIHSIHNDGKLALKIADALQAAGQTTVKVYFRKGNGNVDYYFMHRLTGNTVTHIVEYCFIDNENDFTHFKAHMYDYAEAVVRAFCSHIGHPYKAPAAVTEKPAATKPAEPKGGDDMRLTETTRTELKAKIAGAYKEKVFTTDHTAKVDKYTDEQLLNYGLTYLLRKSDKGAK